MNYSTQIKEELGYLQILEKQQSKAKLRDAVRLVRLLKSGQCTTQLQAAESINLSLRQVQRIWKAYQTNGIEALIAQKPPTYRGKLSTFQITRLRQYLFDDQAQTLADIQAYLAASLGVSYTIGGVFDLCKRLNIKAKTGRPVHAHQRPGALEAYKKRSPN
ncbi:helix-turn-helix domain-containing protein [Spirosoma foliorum]|uniref:Winged helix-turn-helix domain-containing protein n=1 Tax=Spirosoma foliorum TaxID=2710596 RepID=A0A7G5GSJ5_9BACT|nr:winged helix-turn-helix domain-containing protein [Spirosoma foliorum]QMW01837.1 winged helix-turn-helix domain-containing protein [Spirosoma foliorum]